MILNEAQREFETNIATAPHTFQIKTTAKAFKILTSSLYKNKIKAIIRELSCNAVDAHKAAKNSEPFIVHLPNPLEPHFSVKDFGTGLSTEDVFHLYTTFFESNKTSSNDFIGALGLGSKSPFSYSDSFSVTSRFNGKKTFFTCFLNAGGEPQIMKLTEEDTVEPNGLEVSFNVDKKDFTQFKEEAIQLFKFFTLKPTIQGVSGGSTLIPSIIGKNSVVTDKFVSLAGVREAYIVQGGIAYPVHYSDYEVYYKKFVEAAKKKGLSFDSDYVYFVMRYLVNNDFVIFVDIGTFEVTPSREEISLTEDVAINLLFVYMNTFKAFIDLAFKGIVDIKNEYERYAKLNNVMYRILRLGNYSSLSGKIGSVPKDVISSFKEIKIKEGHGILLAKLEFPSMTKLDEFYKNVRIYSYNKYNKTLTQKKKSYFDCPTEDSNKAAYVEFSNIGSLTFFYFSEPITKNLHKLHSYFKEYPDTGTVFCVQTKEDKEFIEKAFGHPPIIDIATLTYTRESKAKKGTQLTKYTTSSGQGTKVAPDYSAVTYYNFDDNRLVFSQMNYIIDFFKLIKKEFTWYGIPKREMQTARFKKREANLVPFTTLIKEELLKYLEANPTIAASSVIKREFNGWQRANFISLIKALPKDSRARNLLEKIQGIYNEGKKYAESRISVEVASLIANFFFKDELLKMNEIAKPILPQLGDYETEYKKIKSYYPLVGETFSQWRLENSDPQLIHYLNLEDTVVLLREKLLALEASQKGGE